MGTPSPTGKSSPRPSRVAATVKRLIRTRISAGVITVLPLLVTLWVVRLIFQWMRDSSLWVVELYLRSWMGQPLLDSWQVPARLTAQSPTAEQILGNTSAQLAAAQTTLISVTEKLQLLEERLGRPVDMEEFFEILPATVQWGTAIFSVLLTVFFLYAVGLFAANLVGRRVIQTFEQVLERVPLIKTIYRGLKQILASFSGDQTQSFQRVALVPFPQERMRCVAFVTNTFRDSETGEELCSVFIATTPNPTTGYLQILKRSEITELDWSVEEAIRTIMSGGILKPDYLTIVPNKQLYPDGRPPDGALPPMSPPAEGPPTTS
ncbi:MAG: DUF502 domain-containing protein [Phycisphaerae bacterium]|jgi:uncharacterized membrane protein